MRGLGLVPGAGGGVTVAEIISAGLDVTLATGQFSVELEDPTLVATLLNPTLEANIAPSTLGAVYLESSQTATIPTTLLTAEICKP